MKLFNKILHQDQTEIKSPENMHLDNILIIASDPKCLYELIKVSKPKFKENSDIIRMDNGDFAIVIKPVTGREGS